MAAPKQTSVTLTSNSEIKTLSYKESKEFLFMGTITAPVYEPADRSSRAPIDLVAVIDRSGSMEGEKLKLVCQTLEFLLQQLKEDDRLSLVTYDTHVAVDFKLMKMTASNKQIATSLIKQLKAGSSTNLSGGLMEGLNQMVIRQESTEKRSEIASVLLFTDGLANHGITKTADIVRASENFLAKITGACSIFTFGYGSDHDATMLKGIAESGKGIYYYIENADDIPESFADCIGGLLSVVAQNISLVVEPMNGVVIQEVLTHYKNTKEGNKFTITFGDLYSEETRNIICKAVVPAIAKKDDEFDSLKFTLSYFNVLSASPESVSSIAALQRLDITPTEQPVNPLLENQRNRIETASVIKNAKANADKGELDKAKEQIKTVMSKIQSTSTSNDSYSKALLDDLQEAVDGMADKTEYFSKGQKKMAWKSQAHEQERAVGKGGYETKAKKEMKAKAAISIPKKS